MKEQTVNGTFWQSGGAAVPGGDARARMATEVIEAKSVNWVLAVGGSLSYGGKH